MKLFSHIIFVALVLYLLAGCIQNPAEYQEYVIQSTQQVIKNPECTCLICTNSTGSWFKDVFVVNDLSDGSCFFKQNCSRSFIYYYLMEDDFNYVKDFGVGQGSSYAEFEESNLRCNLAENYALRILYSKYRAPMYDSNVFFDTSEADTVECMLEKGVIPIYVMYSAGTYVQDDWIGEFVDQSEVKGAPVFISPEAFFTKDLAENVTRQIDAIYDNCEIEEIEGDVCEEYDEFGDCKKYETVYERGCKVAIFPIQNSDEEFFEAIDSIDKETINDKVSLVMLNLDINKQNYECDAGYALAEIMNRSRYVLNRYRKPSFLIFSIDPSCSSSADRIYGTLYTSIPVMRTVGIIGAIYSQYSDFSGNPFNRGENAYSTKDSDMWFKLCKYYNSPPYKKEPIIYQSDGVNITSVCDYASVHGIDAIETAALDRFDSEKVGEDAIDDYDMCISEIDFGDIEEIAEKWSKWDDYRVSATDDDCAYGYPDVEIMAERCSLSRHLLRALYKFDMMPQSCDEWYDFEKEVNDAGVIDLEIINPDRDFETELGRVAFLYALKKDNEAIYYQVINSIGNYERAEHSGRISISKNSLYKICEPSARSAYDSTPCKVLKHYKEYRDECDMNDLIDWIKKH